MIATIPPAEWLRFMEKEYLSSFIRDGGSAVKFAIPMQDAVRPALIRGLAAAAEGAGYLTVNIDAAATKAHMVDELFYRTAEQIPWTQLCRGAIKRIALEAGYSWVDRTDGALYRHLAEANQVEPQMLLLDLKQAIWKKVFKQENLSKDFRMAMLQMCVADLSGGQDGATAIRVLTEWLTGRNKAVGAVKPFEIYRRINRSTGRFFFEALANWARFAGYPGIVVILDAERLMAGRNPRDNGLFYSKAAVLDAYEVLRQFIDGTGHLNGCLLAIISPPAFLEDANRGIGAYEALKFRVFDEVRDRHLVNPMASLARISSSMRGT